LLRPALHDKHAALVSIGKHLGMFATLASAPRLPGRSPINLS
jgi:hypothetical protein